MEALDVVRRADELSGASEESLEVLAENMERNSFPEGAVLLTEGDPPGPAYLIESGQVALTSKTTIGHTGVIAMLHSGDLLGDMTSMLDRPRSATATAMSDVVAWTIPAPALKKVVSQDTSLAFSLMCSAMDLVLKKDTIVVARTEQARLLEQRDELKNDAVAMMAHDFRSPMAVISGCASILRSSWGGIEEKKRDELLWTISRNVDALADLVEDVLHVASIESGQLEYEIAPFDLGALVSRKVDDLRATLDEARLETQIPADLPLGLGDEKRHWQILTNLLSNAIKFSPPSEPITVAVEVDGDHLQVSVIDRGSGIPPEEVTNLFQKFSRLRQPEGTKTHGTGLGLFICKSMVEAQNGHIWVESAPGEGAAFSYTVPIAT